MSVNESVESQAVPPAGGEVVNVDLRVPGTKYMEKYKYLNLTKKMILHLFI